MASYVARTQVIDRGAAGTLHGMGERWMSNDSHVQVNYTAPMVVCGLTSFSSKYPVFLTRSSMYL